MTAKLRIYYYLHFMKPHIIRTKEEPERNYAAILRGTLFLQRTAALTGSIFELAKLHGRNRPFIGTKVGYPKNARFIT